MRKNPVSSILLAIALLVGATAVTTVATAEPANAASCAITSPSMNNDNMCAKHWDYYSGGQWHNVITYQMKNSGYYSMTAYTRSAGGNYEIKSNTASHNVKTTSFVTTKRQVYAKFTTGNGPKFYMRLPGWYV